VRGKDKKGNSYTVKLSEEGGRSEEGFNDINIFGLHCRAYKPLL
jgi:hypothetical protein